MATYYVDPVNGNNGWDGTVPVFTAGTTGPKLTANGAEDIPVAANDTVWLRPGAYRETLTLDVSGGAGTPITYIGDTMGEIWGVGGIVRVTGSDNDLALVRANCIVDGAARNYRTFQGLWLSDTTSDLALNQNSGTNWIFRDCAFSGAGRHGAWMINTAVADTASLFERCAFLGGFAGGNAIFFSNSDALNSTNIVRNCIISGYTNQVGISSSRVGGITIQNCTIIGVYRGILSGNLAVGYTPISVTNSIVTQCAVGLQAGVLGEIVGDFNDVYQNGTDRSNVAVGGNSQAYPVLLEMPLLYDGLKLPRDFGALSEWSQVARITDSGAGPADDIYGITRPVTNGKRSWGAFQFKPAQRDVTTTFGGSAASIALPDAGVVQFKVAVSNVATDFTVQVYREANYAGTNPQMIVKQAGVADDVTTDVGAAGGWNELTTNLTPAADPEFVVVELRNNNTAAAGSYAVYFDELVPDPSGVLGEFEQWVSNRETVGDAVQAAGGAAGGGLLSANKRGNKE